MDALRLALDVPEAERPALRYAAEELVRPLGLRISDDPDAPRLGTEAEDVDLLREGFAWLSGARERDLPRDRWGRVSFESMPEGNPLATPVDDLRDVVAQRLASRGLTARATRWDGHEWAVCLTHDLDALRTRRLRVFVGDAVRGRPRRGLQRAVGPDDRLRTAHSLAALAERHGARATFFAKAGTSGPEDVPARPERHRAWFRALREAGHEVGLHPSMEAATDPPRLGAEADRLTSVLGERPRLVRSHFLRWDERVTPAIYAAAGFEADSTLGWSSTPGFRRGTAHPFRLWDTEAGAPSSLWEVPLAVMDTTLFAHQRLSDAAAADALREVFAAARRTRGVAVVLWHNAMDGDPAWWRRLGVLDRAITEAREDGAALLPLTEAVAMGQATS
ncbi:MAG: polysaccharide deacetylase family protein [Bacteroidota bacterium]